MTTVGLILKEEGIDKKTAGDYLDILVTFKGLNISICIEPNVIKGVLAIIKKFEYEKWLSVKVMRVFSKFSSDKGKKKETNKRFVILSRILFSSTQITSALN